MALYSIETHGELQPNLEREWLLTNGLGSFASSTIVGCNTRRYHSLLCAATIPPVGRMVTVSRIGEIIQRPNQPMLELSVNQFADRFHPRGEKYLRRFELDDTARFYYDAEGTKVTKEVLLFWERNTAAVRYTIEPHDFKPLQFSMLPFMAMRDFHALRAVATARFDVHHDRHAVTVRDRALSCHIRCDKGHFVSQQDWWFGQLYAIEAERGQDFTEDLYMPGRFVVEVTEPTTVTIWASTESADAVETIDFDAELKRRVAQVNLPKESPATSKTIVRLTHAANDFVACRKAPDNTSAWTVIAGYPWFADWGRDTMIALPGLFLTTKRFKEAGRVLSVFAHYVSEGMIPNRFDDYTNQPHYNTVDASLWFIHAVHEYARLSGDSNLFETVLKPACRAIIEGYSRGTRFGIAMDPVDGLITQGDATTQLTWMDAKCGDTCFTPRQGKAVEINALWYNALKLMGDEQLAAKVAENFRKEFWVSPFRGLADVVHSGSRGSDRDEKIRPNQIFAVSLPHSALSREQQSAVVEVVRRELLTPVGLRTLGEKEPGYSPHYRGDQFARDRAYHNGTVWPWLIGAFLEAYLKVNDHSDAAKRQAREWLQPLIDHLENSGCVGSISEIFEAQPPHRPVGCFAQAWSVSEVLRLASILGM